jgi:hypothetical protein
MKLKLGEDSTVAPFIMTENVSSQTTILTGKTFCFNKELPVTEPLTAPKLIVLYLQQAVRYNVVQG